MRRPMVWGPILGLMLYCIGWLVSGAVVQRGNMALAFYLGALMVVVAGIAIAGILSVGHTKSVPPAVLHSVELEAITGAVKAVGVLAARMDDVQRKQTEMELKIRDLTIMAAFRRPRASTGEAPGAQS